MTAHARGRIAIIGGSIAGLLAGLLLRRHGWDVHIYERSSDELASRGAGITPHPELFDAFRYAGIDIENALGVRSRGRLLLDRDGAVTAKSDAPQLFASWGLLYRSLRREFPDSKYHNDTLAIRLVTRDRSVEVHFNDNSQTVADWVIGADGLRSLVRETIAPQARCVYAGYVAWRGLVREACLPRAVREQLEFGMTFYLPPGEHMLGYTVAGPGDSILRGHRFYNWVWYRPTPSGTALRTMFTDDGGSEFPDGIPPQRISAAVTAAMRADAAALLPPQFRAVVENTDQPFIQAIVELSSKRLVARRKAVIGDAAFTVRPHIGFGVSKAAGDAATLAAVFSQENATIPAKLRAWEQQRLRFGQAVLKRSADLGCYLGGSPSSATERERHAYFRQADVVLAGIAAPEPYEFLDS